MSKSGDWPSRLPALVGLVAALVVALACGGGPGGGQADEPTRPRASGGAGSTEDGAMTPEEFEGDIQGAVGGAERYWIEQFKASGERFQPIRRLIAYKLDGEVACGGGAVAHPQQCR